MIKKIINYAVKIGACDIHIIAESAPFIRLNSDLIKIENAPIFSEEDVINAIKSITSDEQFKKYDENFECDFAITVDDIRCRINIFQTFTGSAIAIRVISSNIKNLEEIYAPKIIENLLEKKQGLIIIAGPTGSGKSTTAAAMIEFLNQRKDYNIITIEDPIEFVYKPKKSIILQREVGVHTKSFALALKNALREDPGVIFVGEMRDLETISLALTAAETGHLVIATLHTNSAAQTISRIIDVFESGSKNIAKSMLSNSLNAVISQRLIKTKDNKRVAAFEVLIANSSVKNLIREDKIAQIYSMIEINKKQGMVSLKESINDLVLKGFISEKIAKEEILANI